MVKGREEMLGQLSTEAVITMYQRTVVPTLTYNLECWTKIEEKEIEQLEKIQDRVIKSALRLPPTTPYWGILKETGIWPVKKRIRYQRMMLAQILITSEDERLGKKILMEQRKRGKKGTLYMSNICVED